MRIAQVVIGPAGSGKSTYTSQVQEYFTIHKRNAYVINMDPAAENFSYDVDLDVRELISVEDVMESPDMKFGPNGGLIYCMEYILKNMDWFIEKIGDIDDDYLIIDCPGQIEVYTHLDVFKQIVEILCKSGFRVCAVYLLDSHFVTEPSKFISAILCTLSVMVQLELPQVNVLTKIDLLDNFLKKRIEEYVNPDLKELVGALSASTPCTLKKLNESLAQMVDSYSLVGFHTVDYTDEDSLSELMLVIDTVTQYDEDCETQVLDFDVTETETTSQ